MVAHVSRRTEPLPLLIVRTGATPVRQGEPCTDLWMVEVGTLRAAVVTSDGRQLTLDVLGTNDAVGDPSGAPATCTVTAVRPSRLRPVTGSAALTLLAARARRTEGLARDLAWLDVPMRIERRLQDLAARFGRPTEGGTVIPMRLTQEDLASLAATTRESTNRAVRRLVERGRLHVDHRGRYVVPSHLRLVSA
jgi:CRP/FNR family cyclic AMP-dependent transcriptional regulator